jgi:hypothetical protein
MKSQNREGGRLRNGWGYGSEKYVEEGMGEKLESLCNYCRYYTDTFITCLTLATPGIPAQTAQRDSSYLCEDDCLALRLLTHERHLARST